MPPVEAAGDDPPTSQSSAPVALVMVAVTLIGPSAAMSRAWAFVTTMPDISDGRTLDDGRGEAVQPAEPSPNTRMTERSAPGRVQPKGRRGLSTFIGAPSANRSTWSIGRAVTLRLSSGYKLARRS